MVTQKTFIVARERAERPFRQVVLEGTPEQVTQTWMQWHPQGKVLKVVKEDKTWWTLKRR